MLFTACRRQAVLAIVAGATALAPGCKKAAPAAQGAASPAAAAAAMAVQVVAVEAKEERIVESISLIGSIAPNEMVEVKAETDGTVATIGFKEGERVEKGQLLVGLDETKSKATVAEAEANLKLARTSFDRTKQLLTDRLISQQEYDQASAVFSVNEASLERRTREWKDTRVFAPFGGIAGARQISPGQVITRNSTLTWVVDLDVVKVEVKVPERYLSQVEPGKPLEFSVAAFPGKKFTGEVYFISPQLEESTRTALVKARIANTGNQLKGGMFANLELTLEIRAKALVVPEPSIVNNADATFVFAIDKSGNAVMKPVKVGERMTGKAEILSGLTPGEMVVVEGVQKLRPGAPVKLSPAAAAAPYQK
jgi:membrane fusion protein (multidrug efflux system)